MGLAFLFIAFAVKTWMPGGYVWWFWMFLPAAGLLGDAVSTYLRLSSEAKSHAAAQPYAPSQTSVPPPRQAGSLSPADTGEMIPPPSVTEGTTRHLAVPVDRHLAGGHADRHGARRRAVPAPRPQRQPARRVTRSGRPRGPRTH